MRVGRCVFGLAMLIALDGCGHASARHSAPADPPRTAPASSPASIGHLDCSTLSVPITLDNTAWLATRFFVVERRQPAGDGGQRQVVMLAAGERRSLDLAVRDHRDTTVYISDEDDGETLAAAEIEVSCSPHPAFDARATLQPVSCRDHTLPVMLDNTRSEIPAEFSLESSDGAPGNIRFNKTYRVPPGDKTVVRVPVGNDRIEFNVQLVDPPDGVDEWLGDGEGLEYNDYIFEVPCR
jgi:hypothetical protein